MAVGSISLPGVDTPLRSKLLTVVLLRRAGGSLLRNPCPPSGSLEGWGPQAKRSGRDGAKRKVSGGRAAVRSEEEWTYAQRKSSRPPGGSVADSAGKAVGWPDADQGADQGADHAADQSADQGADQGAGQLVRSENKNRAALLVRPALIFGWLHLSQQMCVLKVVISSPHRTLHTSHI